MNVLVCAPHFLPSFPSYYVNIPHPHLYLHSKMSLSFYGPFLVSYLVPDAISCQLNCLTFSLHLSCMNGQIPHLPWLGVKLPTPTAVLKSNSLLPGKGRVSNAMVYPGGEVERMLRLQTDRCRTFFCLVLVLVMVLIFANPCVFLTLLSNCRTNQEKHSFT